MMNTPLPLVIIGTGLAGYNVAKEFRKLNAEREIILISQDSGHFYSKPQLSNAFQQQKTARDLIITTRENMAAQLAAQLFHSTEVTSIDPITQEIHLCSEGKTLSQRYGQLVLALGAKPKPFPLLDNIIPHSRINGLDDYERFSAKLPAECTIIGSGLVGCEFAHDFSHRMTPINIVTPDPYPLFGLIPEIMGISLQQALSEKGISWFTQTTLSHVSTRDDSLIDLVLSSGQLISTQHIVTAIGLAPEICLAKQAGLKVNQGIEVDNLLQTSIPNIFALGDCAEIQGVCRQYVAPILQCARALAQTLHGNPTTVILPPMPISLKVSHYPVITLPAAKGTAGQWQIESQGESHKALFINNQDELAGYALSGRYLDQRQSLLSTFQTRRPVGAN